GSGPAILAVRVLRGSPDPTVAAAGPATRMASGCLSAGAARGIRCRGPYTLAPAAAAVRPSNGRPRALLVLSAKPGAGQDCRLHTRQNDARPRMPYLPEHGCP